MIRKPKVSISYNDISGAGQNVVKVFSYGSPLKSRYSIILPDNNMKNPNFYYLKNGLMNGKKFNNISHESLGDTGKFYKFKVNDIVCLVDADDNSHISERYIKDNKNIFSDVNFIFIFQYCYKKHQQFFEIKNKLGIDIYPLIYGTTKNFPTKKFQWENKNHKYTANFAFTMSRRNRQHRMGWVNYVKDDRTFFTDFVKGHIYANILQDTKWGVSLIGSGLDFDGKCYREAEFMSLGMPLAFNYMPCYPFPFYPNVHYLYLKDINDIDLLKKIDPIEYAKKSSFMWDKYFSPCGLSNLLINILFNEKYRNDIPNFWGQFISEDYYLHQKGKKVFTL